MAKTKVLLGTKSSAMIKMYEAGKTVSEISKELDCHYSFVYGVIQRYLGGAPIGIKRESKSDKFREMYDAGMTIGDIAKQTNSNYSYVFGVIKKYREAGKE